MRDRCRRQRMASRLSWLTNTSLLLGYLVTLLGLPLRIPTSHAGSQAASIARRCGCPPKLIRQGLCCCRSNTPASSCCQRSERTTSAASCCSRTVSDDRGDDEPPAAPMLVPCDCGSHTFHGYLVSREPRIPPQSPLLCTPACRWQCAAADTPLKAECIRQPETPPPQFGLDILCA